MSRFMDYGVYSFKARAYISYVFYFLKNRHTYVLTYTVCAYMYVTYVTYVDVKTNADDA